MAVRSKNAVPDGMHTVTTQLFFNGNCLEAIEFYKKAFNALLIGDIALGPDGNTVMHAMIRIGDTNLMMSDSLPDSFGKGPGNSVTASMFLYVDDCDLLFNQAIQAGCSVIHQLNDMFWGDRMGNVRDPFGHYWGIASLKWVLTSEEIASAQEEWIKTIQ